MQTAIAKLRRGLSDKDKGRLREVLAPAQPTVPTVIGAKLPNVEAPSTDDIVVTVPESAEPTAADIMARFEELRRDHAAQRKREPGERVQLGDAVCFDVVGWQDGEAVPFSARRGQWLEVAPDPTLPGFALGLVDAEIAGTAIVDVTLPIDYAVPSLRAKRVVFGVTITEAWEVTLPDEDDPAFLAATGLGEMIDEVMEAIARQLQEELVDTLIERGREMVLDVLADRMNVTLPPGLITDEIRRTWQHVEGDVLISAGATFEDQQRSFAAWREDESTRTSAERRLLRALALGAVAKRDGLAVTKDDVNDCLRAISKATGTPMIDLVTEVQRDGSLQRQLSEKLLSALAEAHVIELADIRFAGADD